jgi:hypothetical protein
MKQKRFDEPFHQTCTDRCSPAKPGLISTFGLRVHTRMRLILIAAGCLSALLPVAGSGTPTNPCGSFTFDGSIDNHGVEQIRDTFSFEPSQCGSNCLCKTICYIQIMRAIDRSTGRLLYADQEQYERTVRDPTNPRLDGWSVDRRSHKKWGYYGCNDDGVSFDRTKSITGSNSSPTLLLDQPIWDANTLFEAVDVPVCIGYYYWKVIFEPGGPTNPPHNEIAADWSLEAVDLSVKRWNDVAPKENKKAFPPLTKMH